MPRNEINPFEVSRAQISCGGLWLEVVNVVFSANLNLLGFTRWNTARNDICEVNTSSVVRIVYFGHKIYPWDRSILFTLGIEGVGASVCTYKSATSEPIIRRPGPASIPFDALYPGITRIELQFHSRAIDSTLPTTTLINKLKEHSGEFRLLSPEYITMLRPSPGLTTTLEPGIKMQLTAKLMEIVVKTERSRLQIESAMKQIGEDTQDMSEIEAILADLNGY